MTLRLVLGWLLPVLLVLGVIVLMPQAAGQWLGISVRSWCLFACAPVTSLLLWWCGRVR